MSEEPLTFLLLTAEYGITWTFAQPARVGQFVNGDWYVVEPVETMPQYGLEYGRVAGISALLLCTDLKPEPKEALLVNYVQVGIDLAGMVRAGHPGWTCWGGQGGDRQGPRQRLGAPGPGLGRVRQRNVVGPSADASGSNGRMETAA
jgi:hypothetical protein